MSFRKTKRVVGSCVAGILLAASCMSLAQADAPRDTATSHAYRDRNFDYFVSGDPAAPRATQTEFGLALMGGGGSVDAAFRFIAARAGFGHIVILRAVGDDSYDAKDGSYGEDFRKKWGPVVSAETLVFHNRDASSDARVLGALKNADGIFLAGGDQSNYIRYWKGTPVQDLLNAHVRANRPIGGSSAGLAILGHYSYTALDGGSLESSAALADPFDAGITLEADFLHLAHLEEVITDTHFSTRHRLGRLLAFVARLSVAVPSANNANRAAVFGIGVDEKTALLIDAQGIGSIAPGSAGNVWQVVLSGPAHLVPGKPLSIENVHLAKLDAASRLDLQTRKVSQAAAEATISLKAGRLTAESIATPILARDRAPAGER